MRNRFGRFKQSSIHLLLLASLALTGCSKKGAAGKSADSTSSSSGLTLAAVTLLSPNTNFYVSSASSLTISGVCTTGATVYLSGIENKQTPCANESFFFSVTPQSDGSFTFSIKQKAPNKSDSNPTTITWVKDASLPDTPVISSPTSPLISNASSITIVGSCSNGNTIEISGDEASSTNCSSGTFTFNISESSDDSYTYSILQRNPNNQASGTVGVYWTRDTETPGPVNLTSPANNPIHNTASLFNISGDCESHATVSISGSDSQTLTCTNGQFSFNSTKNSDGNYSYSIKQTDRAGNESTAVSVNWTRDTQPSAAPIITNHTSPYTSNQASLILSGTCATGETVQLSGAATLNSMCQNSAFSFSIPMSSDGSHQFSINQVDSAGNQSTSTNFVWNQDRVAPSALTISNPQSNPYTSSDSSLNISGSCETGSTISLTGDDSKTTSCTSGSFSIVSNKSVDGTYQYSLIQTDAAGNASTQVALQWNRNSSVPSTPQLTLPSSNPYFSNGSSVTLTGTCEIGNTVTLSGDDSGTFTCLNGTFSFISNKSSDGTYVYSINQTDTNNISSASVSLTWFRDTVAPASPILTSPTSNPSTTNGNSINLTGTCSSGNSLQLSGSHTETLNCSQNNTFTVTLNATTDSTRTYQLSQVDASGNISTAISFSWIRDTSAPSAPQITNLSTPHYSNLNTLTLSGSCETGNNLILSGDATGSAVCTSGTFSFNSSKSQDGEYNYSITQTDSAGNTSTSTTFKWYRDTAAPTSPSVTNPASNPYTSADDSLAISGSCETGSSVSTSGAETLSANCVAGSYSLTLSQTTDGNHVYSIKQTDLAGNPSESNSFQWSRSSSVPTTPSITYPTSNPFFSNQSSLTITGTCTDGNTVVISGDHSATTACSLGEFSFTVSKSVDSSYAFTVKQRNPQNVSSAGATLNWFRDTVAPSAPTVTSPASSPYLSNSEILTLSGTCTAGNSIVLSGDGSGTTTCTQSNTFSLNVTESSEGSHIYQLTQVDSANNSSTGTSFTWSRDTTAPAALVITSHSSPYISNTNSIILTGSCESNSTITVTGAVSTTATCSGGSFSVNISKNTDGSHVLSLTQTDSSGNLSNATSFTWNRDTSAPSAPTISNPASNPYTSSGSSLTLSGACETEATVSISGDASSSTTCSSSAYSFSVNSSSDGTYSYAISQSDPAGNTSASASFQWNRSSSIPETPNITSPASNPYRSSETTIAVSGACNDGNTVELSGDSTGSTACSSGTFNFSITKSADSNYSFTFKQKTSGGVYSAGNTLTWTRDTVAPAAPAITSPASSPYYSKLSSLTLSGTCTAGESISLSGDATGTTSCSPESTFSFSISKSADATYQFIVRQVDTAGNSSSSAYFTWIKDTISPTSVTLANPTENPYTSGDTNLSLSGSCEAGATVALTIDGGSTTTTCSESGTYAVTATKSVDGTYNYTLQQTDRAGNQSANYSFTWSRVSTVPFTPVIVTPASNPYYSNTTQLSFKVTCEANSKVYLLGNITEAEVTQPVNLLYVSCSSGTATFTLNKTAEGTYNIYAYQLSSGGTPSGTRLFTWTRDSTAPSAPVIVNPSTSPYQAPGSITLNGTCEPNATINITSTGTVNTSCTTNGSFSTTLTAASDGTYNYSITQTDLAGNLSGSTSLSWIRSSASIAPPTISSPSTSTLVSNGSSITVSGTCTSAHTVELTGGATASVACSGGSYQFVINKSADATYTFSVKQTLNGASSSSTSLTWIRDTVAPTTTITENPPSTNCLLTANFAFNSNETGAKFECKLDYETAYTTCTSPKTFETINNGSRSLSIRAIDGAGNVGTPAVYSWTQNAFKTLALYHLNSTNTTTDSSGYGNHLTATGAPTADTTGVLPVSSPQSRGFGSGKYYSAANNACISAPFDKFTLEFKFKIASAISTTGNYYGLFAKTGTTVGNFGWEYRLYRNGGTGPSPKYYLRVMISMDGQVFESIQSVDITVATNTWYSVAITSNTRGRVEIWFGQNSMTRVSVSEFTDLSKFTFNSTSANMLIGTNASFSSPLNGSLDEIRMSQIVRPISSSISNQEFTAD